MNHKMLSCANKKTKCNENNPKAIRACRILTDQALVVDCDLQDNLSSNIPEDGTFLLNSPTHPLSMMLKCDLAH